MTSYLLDTGFLYALINRSEQKHEEVVAAASAIRGSIVLPVPAITETAYLLLRDVGSEATADFIESLQSTTLQLENPEPTDYAPSGSDSGIRRRSSRLCGCVDCSDGGAALHYHDPHT